MSKTQKAQILLKKIKENMKNNIALRKKEFDNSLSESSRVNKSNDIKSNNKKNNE